MKRLLILYFLFSTAFLKAEEVDGIAIIMPISYERSLGRFQTFDETLDSALRAGLLDSITALDMKQAFNLSDEVKKEIAPYQGDLSKYFPGPEELNTFVDKVVNEGKHILTNSKNNNVNDDKLIRFYEHLGKKLIGGIADKILKLEGVKDFTRRELWVKKILAPFQACIAKSKNSKYDANHCINALTHSLVPSTGIAVVFELSKARLNSSLPQNQREAFNLKQVNIYKRCLKETVAMPAEVKQCALGAMSSGVLTVTEPTLSKIISDSASSDQVAKIIKQKVWPIFNLCNQKVGSDASVKLELSDQFVECIDSLVQNTGVQLVPEEIGNNPKVKSNFTAIEIEELKLDEVESFKKCFVDQKKNNARINGVLDTTKCKNSITNEITYKVVIKNMAETAKEIYKKDLESALKAVNFGKHLLGKCWSNDQSSKEREPCLRKTILSFSQFIATDKLNIDIPEDYEGKAELAQTTLKDLSKCLQRNLPINISEAKNLKAVTGACSNKATLSVARRVARDTVYSRAIEKEISEEETNQLVKKLVEQTFNKCLGAAPSDTKLEVCSGDLKKSATKAIILSYEKSQIKKQLKEESTPPKLQPVEDTFIACIDSPSPAAEVSQKVDECTKQFALGFARTLGELKFNQLMKSVLGLNTYNGQKKSLDLILDKYNMCINNLKELSMKDKLLDKLIFCVEELEHHGLKVVSSNIKTWMGSDQDNAINEVKNNFANFLPCLRDLIPSSPNSQALQDNAASGLEVASALLKDYILYSPENAQKSLEEIIKISSDLKDIASNPAERKSLIDALYKNGALDQFLKSYTKEEVRKNFDKTSEAELPKELRMALLSKENFDKIFSGAEGKAIKDIAMEKILKPVLMDQLSLDSPLIAGGKEVIKDRVIKLLVSSPYLGEQIIKINVQNKINEKISGATRFWAKLIYGRNTLNWDKVRTSPDGKIAEDYIMTHILLPKFQGLTLSKQEVEKQYAEAEKLVTIAAKKYN